MVVRGQTGSNLVIESVNTKELVNLMIYVQKKFLHFFNLDHIPNFSNHKNLVHNCNNHSMCFFLVVFYTKSTREIINKAMNASPNYANFTFRKCTTYEKCCNREKIRLRHFDMFMCFEVSWMPLWYFYVDVCMHVCMCVCVCTCFWVNTIASNLSSNWICIL